MCQVDAVNAHTHAHSRAHAHICSHALTPTGSGGSAHEDGRDLMLRFGVDLAVVGELLAAQLKYFGTRCGVELWF